MKSKRKSWDSLYKTSFCRKRLPFWKNRVIMHLKLIEAQKRQSVSEPAGDEETEKQFCRTGLRQACRAGGLAENIRKTVCNPMQECYLYVLYKKGRFSLFRGKISLLYQVGKGRSPDRPFCFAERQDDFALSTHTMTIRPAKF